MSKALFIRTAHGLMPDPDDERSRTALSGIALGSTVQVDVTRPRNIARHRLYWLLCSRIAQSIPGNLTAENLSDILKIETGHCKIIKGRNDFYKLPQSIAFHKMDEPEFAAYLDRCCEFICRTWIPHMPANELRDDILRLVGVPIDQAA